MVADSIIVVIILITFSILFFTIYPTFKDINDAIQDDPDFANETKEATNQYFANYPSNTDNIFIIIVVMLWIGGIIASFLIDSHPAFFIISLILLFFVLGIAMIMSNFFNEITTDESFDSFRPEFPMMVFIMEHLFETVLFIAVSIGIALFAKNRLQG